MKSTHLTLMVLSLMMIWPSEFANAQAQKNCLYTEVGGVSSRLVSLTIQKPTGALAPENPAVIEVRAQKDDGVDIVTSFQCIRQEEHILCIQPDGAGDFYLKQEKGSFYFETLYLNFALGARSGLPPRKEQDPIFEDYAIIMEDSADEGSHPTRVRLKADEIRCPKPENPTSGLNGRTK